MNDKCRYCRYLIKCSEQCEYDSALCLLNRSFPKFINKTYEELVDENEDLKTKLAEKRIESHNSSCVLGELEKWVENEIEKREQERFKQEQLGVLTNRSLLNLKMEQRPFIRTLNKLQELKGEDK